jgi:glutamyl-tRNA reductase
VARPLVERGARELKVANRSPERARQLQEEIPQAVLIPFDERVAAVRTADVVVVSTGAEEPVLTRRQLREAMSARPTDSLLVVDLGVPRNVEPSAGRIGNLFLHTIDSLEVLIQRNLKLRREEVPRVEEILEQEMEHFRTWYRALGAEPVVARLQRQAERIRQHEVAQTLHRFPPETHADLDRLTRALVRKILHHPSSHLRNREAGQDASRLEMVRELFHLDDDEQP